MPLTRVARLTVRRTTTAATRTRAITAIIRRFTRATVMERITLIRGGVPASLITTLVDALGLPKQRIARALGIAVPTLNRKLRDRTPLNTSESERVVGLAQLIDQVDSWAAHVSESAPPDFRASRWLGGWLATPASALNGHEPLTLLDTADGRALVANALRDLTAGAY